jgi:predicted ATPase
MREVEEIVVLEAACVPYGETNVWWPIANALSTYLDIDASTPLDTAKEVVRDSFGPLFADAPVDSSEQLLEVFAHLMGHPSSIDRLDATNARSTIHSTVTTTIDAWAQRAPLALSIDDLHWADPMLVDLLEHLVSSLGRHRFILVTAMRPGSDVAWPPQSDRAAIVSLNLQPLTRHEHDALARALLNDDAAEERLLEALFDRSGGNPLFLHAVRTNSPIRCAR